MKILTFGDIYGRIGRRAFLKEFPIIRAKYNPDFTIVNVDNITSGRGATTKHVKELIHAGVDVLTGGDHIIDNLSNISDFLDSEQSPLLRPANLSETPQYPFPGMGHRVFEKNGKRILVIHLLGHIFMTQFNADNAFTKADEILEIYEKEDIKHVIIDFHREATSEVQAMAAYLDGRVSVVFGTHTHVQTNDDLIWPGGTGMLSDVGMSGSLYSVIGADFHSVKKIFLTGISKGKIEQSLDPNYRINAALFELDDAGKCVSIEKINIIQKGL